MEIKKILKAKKVTIQQSSLKLLFQSLLFLLTVQLSYAQDWNILGKEEQISNEVSVNTSIVVLNDVPYVVFANESGAAVQVKRKDFSTGNWVQFGDNIGTNLAHPRIFLDKSNNFYVTYIDTNNEEKLAVKIYNQGTGTWQPLNNDANNLYVSTGSVNTTQSAYKYNPRSSLAFDSNNIPFIAFGDNGVLTPYVKKFDGNSWETVGGDAVNASTIAVSVSLVIDEADVLWLSFSSLGGMTSSTGALRLYKFGGTTWDNIATPVTTAIRHPVMALNSLGNPVIGYFNTGNRNRATVIDYNKTAASWNSATPLSNRDAPEISLVKDSEGNLYCSFVDQGSPYNIGARVFKQDMGSTSWTEMLGTSVNSAIDEPANDLSLFAGNTYPFVIYTKLNSNGVRTPIVQAYFKLITTSALSNISSTSVTTGGEIFTDAGSAITERGIVYGTNVNPTIADSKIIDETGSGVGTFATTITGLTPNTTYHIRAYATNSTSTYYGENLAFVTTSNGDPSDVLVIDNGATVILKNHIVEATINKSNATVTSLIYNGLELIQGGFNGGSIYWSWNMPSYQNPSNCVYTLVTDPNSNNFDGAEIKLHMTWDGTPSTAAMDVDIYYSLQRNTSGLYAAATLSHPASYPRNPGGEWRMSSYPNPRFDWLSVDELRNRLMPSKFDLDNSLAVDGAPVEVTLLTTGIYKDKYECKYDYSADFGDIDTWGWSSTADNVGLWVTAPSKEYYPGGPDNTELLCHATPVMLNMLGGTHFGYGQETEVAAGEEWQKDFGPFLLYCNKVDPGTENAPIVLWEDAKAKAKSEQGVWPYDWHANPAYVKQDGRGTVTGKLVIDDSGNPSASAANSWVGLGIPPVGSTDITQFQRWSKNYQFWVKTDENGNFTIPDVLPGTYNLFAYGSGANGQLTLSNYATVTAGATTALGNVTWIPTRHAATVWEIGVPDRDSREFRHGDDWWTSNTYPDERWGIFLNYPDEFPNDVNFTIGESDIATDWNFVHYWDKNKRASSPEWKINFSLDDLPSSGSTASVYVAVAEMKSSALILSVNGTNVTVPSTGIGFNDKSNAMLRKSTHGTFNEIRFDFLADHLKLGENQISFKIRIGGSETLGNIMYDYIRMEADIETLSIDSVGKIDLVKLYPNPTRNNVKVSLPNSSILEKVEVYNNLGQLVSTQFNNTVSLEKLESGYYYFLIVTSNGSYTKKIIKM